ncbi:MAG: glycosyl hydrolase family 65 protein [Planctomycetota bacterium]
MANTDPALDPWVLGESAFRADTNRRVEGLMALGNGVLHQRAAPEEGLSDAPQDIEYLRVPPVLVTAPPPAPPSCVGTYLAGVCGSHPICGEEWINLPALHGLMIYSAGERLDMTRSRLTAYRRRLHLRTGRLVREFVWHTPSGSQVGVRFERLVSARRRHVMALRGTWRHLTGPPVELRFLGPLDGDVRTGGYDHFDTIDITGEHEPVTLAVRTKSGLDVGSAALLTSDRGIAWTVEVQPRWVACCATATLDPGTTLTVDKFAAVTSSRHVRGSPVDHARKLVWDAAAAGFERVAAESDAVWTERWDRCDVQIDGDPESQLALRVCLYHLLRVTGDGEVGGGLDAGAGGAGAGRTTADADLFALPVFLHTRPDVAARLARVRVAGLEAARRLARRDGYAGARYLRRGTPSGVEPPGADAAADYAVHATAEVAHALFHAHLGRPHDKALLRDVTEALTEIARYAAQRVTEDPARDPVELLMVSGPDEYAPLQRNHAYTNRLVAFALTAAVFAHQKLEQAASEDAAALRERLALDDAEPRRWLDLAQRLRLPYDSARRLVLPSDDFSGREPFDLGRWWPDRSRPLSAVVSRERLRRSRVLQQADVLRLIALFPHEFDAEQTRIAYEAYEPLTAHDGPLSYPLHTIVAATLGRLDDAQRFWRRTCELVLNPTEAAENERVALAGACWQAAVLGFGGLRTRAQSEVLYIDPHLPPHWSSLRFAWVWEGQPLTFHIQRDEVCLAHHGDRPLTALVFGRLEHVAPRTTSTFRRN